MIREFANVDARRIKANEFSNPVNLGFVFHDDHFYKFTLVDENEVKAIICFARYWKNNFVAFFLISEDISISDIKELKRFIYDAAIDFEADRIQTESIAEEKIDKWHKFLGFKLEGRKEKMVYNKDYHCWAILKGRDF